MKIIVYKDLENNCILQVASMEFYRGKKKTEADVEEAITKFNMEHPKQQYVTLECSAEVYDAVCFILGEHQYSKAHSLDDIFFQLTELKDRIDGMKSDVEGMQSDLVDTMNNVDSKIEKATWKETQLLDKACNWLLQWNTAQVVKHGSKAVLGCKDFTIPVNEFKKAMKGEEDD